MTRRLTATALVTAACALLLTSGCGFRPLYATPSFAALPGLAIETGESRLDYLIEDGLRDFLGSGRSAYSLALDTRTDERSLGVSAAGRASRFSYRVTTAYLLSSDDGEVLSGTIQETVFIDAPRDPYALVAARADADERAATLIARRLAEELSAGLERRRTQAPS
jgi:LPS-assembly lipoprotein